MRKRGYSHFPKGTCPPWTGPRGNPITRKNYNRSASQSGGAVSLSKRTRCKVGGWQKATEPHPTRRLAASRKTNRLAMYGTIPHQRNGHSVDIEGALCPHMDPSAFSTLFGASKRVRPPRRRPPRGETPAFKQLIANLNGGFNPPPAEPLRGCPAFLTALDFHFMQTPSRFSDYIFPYPGLYYLRYPTGGQAR